MGVYLFGRAAERKFLFTATEEDGCRGVCVCASATASHMHIHCVCVCVRACVPSLHYKAGEAHTCQQGQRFLCMSEDIQRCLATSTQNMA